MTDWLCKTTDLLKTLSLHVAFNKTFRASKASWGWWTCPSWLHCFKSNSRFSAFMLWHLTLVSYLKSVILKVPSWSYWIVHMMWPPLIDGMLNKEQKQFTCLKDIYNDTIEKSISTFSTLLFYFHFGTIVEVL